MARKADSFRVVEKGKKIIVYTNVEMTEAEEKLFNTYVKLGYTPLFEEKKPSKTVEDMRKELSADKDALKQFEEIYNKKKKKGDKSTPFFDACKFYQQWAKEKK